MAWQRQGFDSPTFHQFWSNLTYEEGNAQVELIRKYRLDPESMTDAELVLMELNSMRIWEVEAPHK